VLEPYFSLDALERLFGAIGRDPTWLRLPEQQLFHVYLFLRWHQVFIEGAAPTAGNQPAVPGAGPGDAAVHSGVRP
jgi:hypothetical protein